MLSKMTNVENAPPKEYEKMKLHELKPLLKEYGLKLTGNKSELIGRLRHHKLQSEKVVAIQRIFRGYTARLWIKLKKGTRNSCVNEMDFYTMEPIDEIPFYYYIHYTEEKSNTSYTFNIMSLCSMISKSGKFENPYTRENMKMSCGPLLAKIIRLTLILFPHHEIVGEMKEVYNTDKITVDTIAPVIRQPIQNLDRRITELFIAIDTLGHYTQKEWFMNLSNSQVCTLVMRINTLWATTTNEVRQNISPGLSPFSVQNTGVTRMTLDRTLEENRAITIKIGESLVYKGTNNEYKIMGVMFFLTGLTTVSYPARIQMPWLYDNYNFLVARV
jgi:hypothetical protein